MGVSTLGPISRIREITTTHAFFANLSVAALASTLLLIVIGSIVRVTGNGLGCPDWPLCHGRAIPPLLLSAWVEFFHRLFGAAVVLQIGILILLVRRLYRSEKWFFRTAVAASVALTVQVLLGGIHVIYELPRWTGWIHTAVAMIVVGLVAVWVALTRPALTRINRRSSAILRQSGLTVWTTIAAAATFVLILTGSLVTRTGASLVCPNFPSCGLALVPDYLQPIVLVQMTHRYTALVVAFTICLVTWFLLTRSQGDPDLRRFAGGLVALIVIQLGLGVANVLFALPMWSRILHLGTAGTIWVTLVMLRVALRPKKTVPQQWPATR
jgi:heme A synthase